jgi:AraC family transcriptional regulator
MKKADSRTYYQERLNRVTGYIYDHLDDQLDLNRLADIACLSPYHWHRIYQAMHGETIAATVKRLRLHRAAGYLANTSMAIEKVAEKSGYGNLQSFTRIFHSVYGMPPARYRKQGSHTSFPNQGRAGVQGLYEIAIKSLPSFRMTAIEHVGSYMQIGRAFDTLYACLSMRNLVKPGLRSIAIYLDDPSAVAEEELRSRAGVILDADAAIEPPLAVTEISAGDYAVLRHKGPYADMKAAYQWLFGEWLVQSGKEAADAPVFEEYLNSPHNTAPLKLITDIYLPLRSHPI